VGEAKRKGEDIKTVKAIKQKEKKESILQPCK